MITVEIGVPVVVSKDQYNYIMSALSGLCFGRVATNGDHLIKLAISGHRKQPNCYKKTIETYLNQTQR